jgi:hypothetical protein
MLAMVGELPNGVLALPRLLSNLSDAPMLGEAAILWQLSIQPEPGFVVQTGGTIPVYAYLVLTTVFLFGVWRIWAALGMLRSTWGTSQPAIWAPQVQLTAWVCLTFGAVLALVIGREPIGVMMLVAGTLLPIRRRKKKERRIPMAVEAAPVAMTGDHPGH